MAEIDELNLLLAKLEKQLSEIIYNSQQARNVAGTLMLDAQRCPIGLDDLAIADNLKSKYIEYTSSPTTDIRETYDKMLKIFNSDSLDSETEKAMPYFRRLATKHMVMAERQLELMADVSKKASAAYDNIKTRAEQRVGFNIDYYTYDVSKEESYFLSQVSKADAFIMPPPTKITENQIKSVWGKDVASSPPWMTDLILWKDKFFKTYGVVAPEYCSGNIIVAFPDGIKINNVNGVIYDPPAYTSKNARTKAFKVAGTTCESDTLPFEYEYGPYPDKNGKSLSIFGEYKMTQLYRELIQRDLAKVYIIPNVLPYSKDKINQKEFADLQYFAQYFMMDDIDKLRLENSKPDHAMPPLNYQAMVLKLDIGKLSDNAYAVAKEHLNLGAGYDSNHPANYLLFTPNRIYTKANSAIPEVATARYNSISGSYIP